MYVCVLSESCVCVWKDSAVARVSHVRVCVQGFYCHFVLGRACVHVCFEGTHLKTPSTTRR